MFNINDKIKYMDRVSDEIFDATIVFIEPDPELGFYWIYIKFEKDSMNDKYDYRFGMFGAMIESTSDYIGFEDD